MSVTATIKPKKAKLFKTKDAALRLKTSPRRFLGLAVEACILPYSQEPGGGYLWSAADIKFIEKWSKRLR